MRGGEEGGRAAKARGKGEGGPCLCNSAQRHTQRLQMLRGPRRSVL